MADFDPNAFLAQSTPAPQGPSPAPQGQAARSAGSSFDPHAFLNEAPSVDPNTGEEIPDRFSGKTPDTAMNLSPLSALDRFKLSVGNEKGQIDYLKQRFDAVSPIPDKDGKPTKDLAVLQHGKWSRVDAVNSEIKDPWEMAKEYAKDAVEYAPEALGLGVAAATGLVTEGMSVPASAAIAGGTAAAVRTSLGRIVGTYEATPQDQLYDTAFETLLNAAGAKVMMGVKPTAKWIADKIPQLAEKFAPQFVKDGAQALAGTPKALFKKVFAGMSVGEDNFDLAVEHPMKLQATMKSVWDATGGKVSAYHDEISNQQTEQMKSVAQNARGTLTQIYGKMKDKLLSSVPENFSANFDDAIQSSYAGALEKGIGKVVTQDGKTLVGADAVEHLAQSGLKGAKFSLLSQEEMTNAVHAGEALKDEMGYLATDKEAYQTLKEYFDQMGKFANSAQRSGKQAAEDLLTFKKIAADKAWALQNMEKVRDIPAVRNIVNQSRVAVDNAIHGGLKKAGVGGLFTEMNATYSQLAEKFSPLLNANYRFEKSGDPKVYESLLSQFLAKPGKQVTNKFAVDAAIDAAQEHGLGSLAKQLSNSKLKIQIGQAAKAFNPLPSETKKTIASGTAGAMMAALYYGHPGLAAAAGTAAALRSPTTAKAGVMLTQAAYKGQQLLAGMPKQQLSKFLDNPEAVVKFTTAILQAPQVHSQVSSALQQQIAQPPGTPEQ